MSPKYPNALRLPLVDDYHGHEVADPYRWLEDLPSASDGAAEPDGSRPWSVLREEWSRAQAELFKDERETWESVADFEGHLTGFLAGGFTGLPTWRGDRYFFSRRLPGQQFPVFYTVDPEADADSNADSNAGGTERVLLDPMELDESGKTTLDSATPSRDGNRLAYLISEGGDEESVLYVMDVVTGERLDGPIDRTRFSSVAWLPGGEQFYYVRRLAPDQVPDGEAQFHRRVYLHTVGADPKTDIEIFGADRLKTEYFSVSTTRNGRWLIIDASEGTAPRNDVYLAELGDGIDPGAPTLRTVVEGRDAMTGLSIRPDDRMFVWTDHEAPRGRILTGDPHNPTPENWEPFLAEDSDSVLESYRFLDGPDGKDQYIVITRTRHSIGEVARISEPIK